MAENAVLEGIAALQSAGDVEDELAAKTGRARQTEAPGFFESYGAGTDAFSLRILAADPVGSCSL